MGGATQRLDLETAEMPFWRDSRAELGGVRCRRSALAPNGMFGGVLLDEDMGAMGDTAACTGPVSVAEDVAHQRRAARR